MLSFQVLEDGKTIQIYCDHTGMATLLARLASLVGHPGHVHLRAESPGRKDLSEVDPFGQPACSEVIIDYSPDYP